MKTRQIDRTPDEPGEKAEKLASSAYRFNRIDAQQYDLRRNDSMVAEVKATLEEHDSGARGRFRVWKDQHEELLKRDRDGYARYIFVLFGNDTASLKIKRPAEIGNIIGARGGWNQSGHQMGPQRKLPYSAIFDNYD